MKECATDKAKYLDVCYLQSVLSLSEREHTSYYMTLLSHAAVHGQKEMVEELLSNGASKELENMLHIMYWHVFCFVLSGLCEALPALCSLPSQSNAQFGMNLYNASASIKIPRGEALLQQQNIIVCGRT